MNPYTVHYAFSQAFNFPAKTAYDWCVDYKPDDWARMGLKGTRKVKRINEDTLILTDTVMGESGSVTKQRLVRLNPDRLAWTNTHLTGPNRHSQFWYQIVVEGRAKSRLDFIGLQVNYEKRPSPARLAEMAEELATEDSGHWQLLAKEMRKDLSRQRR